MNITSINQQKQAVFRELVDTVPMYGNNCHQCKEYLTTFCRRRGELKFCNLECEFEWYLLLRQRYQRRSTSSM